MNRPIMTRMFSEFVRPINGVNDPDTFGAEAATIVGCFFGQDHIIGPCSCQRAHDVAMASNIAFVFEIPIVNTFSH